MLTLTNLNMLLCFEETFCWVATALSSSLLTLPLFIPISDINVTKLYPHLGLACRGIEIWTAGHTILMSLAEEQAEGTLSKSSLTVFHLHWSHSPCYYSIHANFIGAMLLVKHKLLGYGVEDRGIFIRFLAKVFIFPKGPKSALGPTQPSIPWVKVTLFLRQISWGVKLLPPYNFLVYTGTNLPSLFFYLVSVSDNNEERLCG